MIKELSETLYNLMPKIYLLKKFNPQDSIWKHYPEDDFVRWVGDDEEEARKNAARGSLPRNKAKRRSMILLKLSWLSTNPQFKIRLRRVFRIRTGYPLRERLLISVKGEFQTVLLGAYRFPNVRVHLCKELFDRVRSQNTCRSLASQSKPR